MKPEIIFDLDGTLIDSAPGILAAFAGAFQTCQRELQHPLSNAIIGPPLQATLGKLAGTNEPTVLQPLLEAFKANYDEQGYRLTTVFPGVNAMLGDLHTRGYTLHIATNKRILPTRKILDYFNWTAYFEGVHALDTFDPPLQTKAHMLGEILALNNFQPQHTLYIGDRQEDGEAAQRNAMPFLLAAWGYDEAISGAWQKVETPEALLSAVATQSRQ